MSSICSLRLRGGRATAGRAVDRHAEKPGRVSSLSRADALQTGEVTGPRVGRCFSGGGGGGVSGGIDGVRQQEQQQLLACCVSVCYSGIRREF